MAISIALVLAGCSPNGLPHGARVVGGGLKISWSPQGSDSGTAILIEKVTGKTVITKQLIDVDRSFDFDVTDAHDEKILQAVFGGSAPTNAQYVLYFVPTH